MRVPPHRQAVGRTTAMWGKHPRILYLVQLPKRQGKKSLPPELNPCEKVVS